MVLTDNRADAEDAVQECVLKACEAYESFRGDSSPTTWMYRILVNVAARRRQNEARRPRVPLDDRMRDSLKSPVRPDLAAEQSDELLSVLCCLRALPPRQREIAALFYLEDLSYAQVAGALGISVDTVKSALCRARQALRRELAAPRAEGKVPNELPR